MRLGRWLLVAVGVGALGNRAQAAPPVHVRALGDCPSSTEVEAALDYLLKGAGAPADAAGLSLTVVDLGPRYQVALAGQAREYADAQRDCAERARVAAVFAAATMEPPEVAARRKPEPPPPRRFELRAGTLVDVGVRQSHQVVASGGELRAALVGQRWGVEFGAGGLVPADIVWGNYQARITRFPMDIGVRGVRRRGFLVASLSAGAAMAIFSLRGEGTGLATHHSGTRLDLGFRSALSLSLFPAGRLSPFVDLHVFVWPQSYTVTVEPVGQVGTTPIVWVGATLGLAVRAL